MTLFTCRTGLKLALLLSLVAVGVVSTPGQASAHQSIYCTNIAGWGLVLYDVDNSSGVQVTMWTRYYPGESCPNGSATK
jgi:hypothetical protein